LLGGVENNDRHKGGRKARQLCRQVAETVELTLSGDCRDEILQSLHVVSVEPAPDSSRLRGVVVADLPAEQFHWAEILARLERKTARLRSEVAGSLAGNAARSCGRGERGSHLAEQVRSLGPVR